MFRALIDNIFSRKAPKGLMAAEKRRQEIYQRLQDAELRRDSRDQGRLTMELRQATHECLRAGR